MSISQDLLSQVLEQYLHRSKVSLSSLASKLDMSKSHLSDIKNGKAKAGMDLGLKILKSCGADLKLRKKWLDHCMRTDIPEYEELQLSIVNEDPQMYLPDRLGEQLSHDLTLLHIILDIIEEKELGLSQTDIKIRYGDYGLHLADLLMRLNTVKFRHGRYYADNQRLILSKKSSYSFIETVLREQKSQYLKDSYEGRFEFQIDDVSDSVLEELYQLHQDYVRRMAETIRKSRHMQKSQKKNRVLVQALTCLLRKNLNSIMGITLFFLCGTWLLPFSTSWAGGLGGGSNHSQIQILQLSGFKGEKTAIAEGAKIEELVNQEVYDPIKKWVQDQCQQKPFFGTFTEAKVERYTVERYFAKNEELYELKLQIQILCEPDKKEQGWNQK